MSSVGSPQMIRSIRGKDTRGGLREKQVRRHLSKIEPGRLQWVSIFYLYMHLYWWPGKTLLARSSAHSSSSACSLRLDRMGAYHIATPSYSSPFCPHSSIPFCSSQCCGLQMKPDIVIISAPLYLSSNLPLEFTKRMVATFLGSPWNWDANLNDERLACCGNFFTLSHHNLSKSIPV